MNVFLDSTLPSLEDLEGLKKLKSFKAQVGKPCAKRG